MGKPSRAGLYVEWGAPWRDNADVAALSRELRDEVRWFDTEREMAAYLTSGEVVEWYRYDGEFQSWLRRLTADPS